MWLVHEISLWLALSTLLPCVGHSISRPVLMMEYGRKSRNLHSRALASLLFAFRPTSYSPGTTASTRQARRTFPIAELSDISPGDEIVLGPILRPSTDPNKFDSACLAHPVVLPPSVTGTGKWQCYYYGNPGHWAADVASFLPTGWTGLAESDDGIHWEKVAGQEEGGSVLAPTGNPSDWDGIHLGVGDVIRIGEGELHMYYFGGSGEESEGISRAGIRMRIGRARSIDGGRSWQRLGMVLDYDDQEGLFASWPRVMLPGPDAAPGTPWKLLYHAFNGTCWNAFGATSLDQGDTWTRDGMILGPGEQDAWDNFGIGCRDVARLQTGQWVMVYEAVGGESAFVGKHRLGIARLVTDDVSGATRWIKDVSFSGTPGGPILEPGVQPLETWTSQVIGTPNIVALDDGSVRLYFCSKQDQQMKMHIGLVVSESGDLSPLSWKPISL